MRMVDQRLRLTFRDKQLYKMMWLHSVLTCVHFLPVFYASFDAINLSTRLPYNLR